MSVDTIKVTLAAGEARHGIWCPTCLTSAAFEIDVYAFSPTSVIPIGTLTVCARCEEQAVEESEQAARDQGGETAR